MGRRGFTEASGPLSVLSSAYVFQKFGGSIYLCLYYLRASLYRLQGLETLDLAFLCEIPDGSRITLRR